MDGRRELTVMNQPFVVDGSWEWTKDLGQGAYGVVCAAKNASGQQCAIKKVTKIFTKKILTKRALREIKLLRHLRGHKNIIGLYDMDLVDPTGFDSVYLYIELMEADLHAIIRSGQPLSDAHYQSFIYQTLCGLKYIHSASILHRDLKPGNLLVNADCELKICDFGLARGFEADPDLANQANAGFMTEYVATRWYRAPEIMLSFQNYTTAIDMWSVGCILAELLSGRPIFRGKDYVDQLNQILHYLGTPSERTLRRVGSPRAQDYIRSLPHKPGIPFHQLYTGATPLAIDMLRRLLAFDPAERITCEEALNHPYLAVWHDENDEPLCATKFDFEFEKEDSIEGMRGLIRKEVESFRLQIRSPPETSQSSGPKRQETLPIPSRDEILSPSSSNQEENNNDARASSPEAMSGVDNQHPSNATADAEGRKRSTSPVLENPSDSLDKELEQHHS